MAVDTARRTTVPNASARIRRAPMRYSAAAGRDRRLDMLRGYALAAMAINHFGLSQSYLHNFSGRSRFLVSAAEAFLVISGFTLGYISIGRTPEQVTRRLSSRVWTVYLATIGISLGLGSVALASDFDLWGDLDTEAFDGVWPWVGQVLTMHTAFNGADILIAYVFFLAAAVVALRLMTQRRSHIVIAATTGAYLLSQFAGSESTRLGFESFRALLPNAPLFFGGLLVGFHRERLNSLWTAVPFRRSIDIAISVVTVWLGWMHTSGWPSMAWLGRLIAGPDLNNSLFMRETEMPIASMLVVVLFLRLAWLAVDALWLPLQRALGWLLLPLGEASLFTFVAHLVAIPIMINLPWWSGDDLTAGTATLWVAGYLALIYVAVIARGRVLVWLRSGDTRRDMLRQRGPGAAVALLLAAVIAVATSTGAFVDATFEFDDSEFDEDARAKHNSAGLGSPTIT